MEGSPAMSVAANFIILLLRFILTPFPNIPVAVENVRIESFSQIGEKDHIENDKSIFKSAQNLVNLL
jgi:hypothetical protein